MYEWQQVLDGMLMVQRTHYTVMQLNVVLKAFFVKGWSCKKHAVLLTPDRSPKVWRGLSSWCVLSSGAPQQEYLSTHLAACMCVCLCVRIQFLYKTQITFSISLWWPIECDVKKKKIDHFFFFLLGAYLICSEAIITSDNVLVKYLHCVDLQNLCLCRNL